MIYSQVRRSILSVPLAALVAALVSIGAGRGHAADPGASPSPAAIGLPPLDPAIVALVETNKAAITEHRIFYVTNAEITETQKAQALLLLFKDVPKEDQRKVAHAAVKQVDDTIYFLAREQLLDATLPPQVLSVFMTDTLKRKNRLKAPVLLDLARLESHPLRTEAQQMLVAYLRKDYGTNWVGWEKAVAAWLEKDMN
jgi:hypothetical protein